MGNEIVVPIPKMTESNSDSSTEFNSKDTNPQKPQDDSKKNDTAIAKANLILIDDDPDYTLLLERKLKKFQYNVTVKNDSEDAFIYLKKNPDKIDIVIIDLNMPNLTGIEFVKMMKAQPNLKSIPAILLTASNKKEDINNGIAAGVFYFLNKGKEKDLLKSILESAVAEAIRVKSIRNELERHQISFQLMQEALYNFKTVDEAEHLACFIANCFEDSEKIARGLYELFLNAVEHGNLGIGFEKKSELIKNGNWKDFIHERSQLPEFSDKSVRVQYFQNEDGHYILISDMGEGFDCKAFKHLDPSRANSAHGRGIAYANVVCFDNIEYNEKGNEVIAFVSTANKIVW